MPFDLMAVAEGSTSKPKAAKPKSWSRTNSGVSSAADVDTNGSGSPRPSDAVAVAEQMAAMKKFDQMRASAPVVARAKAAAPTHKPKPASPAFKGASPGPAQRTKDGDWVCSSCTKKNDAAADGDCTVPGSFKFCPACGDSDMGVPGRKAPPVVTAEWDCHCGEVAVAASFCFCIECGAAAGSPPPPPPGVCGGCDEGMPESWKFCPDCRTEAGEWDGAAKARSAGLPPAEGDDWPCKSCSDDIPGSFRFCPECGSGRPA